jgi:hypothetical protein
LLRNQNPKRGWGPSIPATLLLGFDFCPNYLLHCYRDSAERYLYYLTLVNYSTKYPCKIG